MVGLEQVFISVVILLAGARLLGELFRRIKQPALVGELLAGIILGPTLFGIVQPNENLELLSTVAIFFVMLLIGLEMDLREIRKAGKSAFIISIISLTIPFLVGYEISSLFGLSTIQSLFIGLLLSVTSVPVSAIILMELGVLKTKIGTTVLSAAVIDDIISLVILAVILQLHAAEGTPFNFGELGISALQIVGYLVGIAFLAYAIHKINRWFPHRLESFFAKTKTREAIFGILIIVAITLSITAQYAGLHFIIGTFFAGLIFSDRLLGKKEADRAYGIVSGITFGFFAPLFFAIIGMKFSGQSLENVVPLLALLVVFGIFGKTLGGYVGSKVCGFSKQESLAIASLLNGRGTVGLTITSLAFSIGILDITLFSVSVAICFITTMVTPVIARPLLRKIAAPPAE
ncbi:MAG TPA: cation:proton antiporter [Candidatus Nitrosotenuis sp.]|nr:cation:proton antiporter [Candidatus Nitrosotenuis sp.]